MGTSLRIQLTVRVSWLDKAVAGNRTLCAICRYQGMEAGEAEGREWNAARNTTAQTLSSSRQVEVRELKDGRSRQIIGSSSGGTTAG